MRAMICATLAATLLASSTYDREIDAWRRTRESELKADDGWLTVAGLFWLHDGENTAGSDPSRSIALPRGPAYFGVFEYRGGKVAFHAAPGIDVKAPAALRPDTVDGGPDLIQFGDFTMFVIHRGTRDAIRLKDKQSEFRKSFTGLHWYPPREDYRMVAKWVPYAAPKQLAVPNILGETERQPSPGYAVFKLQGREYQLHPCSKISSCFSSLKTRPAAREPTRRADSCMRTSRRMDKWCSTSTKLTTRRARLRRTRLAPYRPLRIGWPFVLKPAN